MEETSIFRQLDFETKLYLEYFVPDDGFTIQVELHIGRVVVCGSNSLERPDCSYSLTYDWRLEISEYEELFIGPDGFPSNTPIPSSATTPTDTPTQASFPTTNAPNVTQTYSNVTVFLTIEGLDNDNIFSLNTTYGDTRAPEGMHLKKAQSQNIFPSIMPSHSLLFSIVPSYAGMFSFRLLLFTPLVATQLPIHDF